MVTGNSTFKNSACQCVDISIEGAQTVLGRAVGVWLRMEKTGAPNCIVRFCILCQVFAVKKKKMPVSLRNILDAKVKLITLSNFKL